MPDNPHPMTERMMDEKCDKCQHNLVDGWHCHYPDCPYTPIAKRDALIAKRRKQAVHTAECASRAGGACSCGTAESMCPVCGFSTYAHIVPCVSPSPAVPEGPSREAVVDEELGEWARIVREAIWYARVTAQSHGYALAVHGSLRRDIDVVAVPWTNEAIAPDELAEKLVAWLVTVGVCHADIWSAATKTREEKPHGRLAWSIALEGPLSLTSRGQCAPYLDLSVVPPRAEAVPPKVTEVQLRRVRLQMERFDKWESDYAGWRDVLEALEAVASLTHSPEPDHA